MSEINPYLKKAVSYLSLRSRSQKALTTYLKQKGASRQDLETCLSKLIEWQLLDDAVYASNRITSLVKKGKGVALIKQILSREGIEKSLIEAKLKEIEPESVSTQIESLAQKYITKHQLSGNYQDKSKLMRFLYSRGYSGSEIRSVIDVIPLLKVK